MAGEMPFANEVLLVVVVSRSQDMICCYELLLLLRPNVGIV